MYVWELMFGMAVDITPVVKVVGYEKSIKKQALCARLNVRSLYERMC
jgi:hypothetical protein